MGKEHGLMLIDILEVPANNKILVFRKDGSWYYHPLYLMVSKLLLQPEQSAEDRQLWIAVESADTSDTYITNQSRLPANQSRNLFLCLWLVSAILHLNPNFKFIVK